MANNHPFQLNERYYRVYQAERPGFTPIIVYTVIFNTIGSYWLSVQQAIDHAISPFVVPLRCHVTHSLEGHQSEIIGECPQTAAVLSSVGSRGVPRTPILLGRQF